MLNNIAMGIVGGTEQRPVGLTGEGLLFTHSIWPRAGQPTTWSAFLLAPGRHRILRKAEKDGERGKQVSSAVHLYHALRSNGLGSVSALAAPRAPIYLFLLRLQTLQIMLFPPIGRGPPTAPLPQPLLAVRTGVPPIRTSISFFPLESRRALHGLALPLCVGGNGGR